MNGFLRTSMFVVGMLVLSISALITQGQAEVYRFDFDSDYNLNTGQHTGTFFTQSEFIQVLPNQIYGGPSGPNWFGWDADLSATARDRGPIANDPLSNLDRDFHFSSSPHTFSVNLADGSYTVILHFRDTAYAHDNIQVSANGVSVLNDVDVTTSKAVIETFAVTITTGKLALQFSDHGGSDPNWIINGIEIVPIPASVLLLGSGLLGLGLLGWRRKRS